MLNLRVRASLVSAIVLCAPQAHAAAQGRTPLSRTDVADIVALEKIEDRRDFDASVLARVSRAAHPELRRRAALAIARLFDPRGRELLRAMRADTDTTVLATVAWATGQLVDTSGVPWLDSLLQRTTTPTGVATEAAGAFGKIRTADTKARLARYLSGAGASPTASANTAKVVAEALLSLGRHGSPVDTSAIARWAMSSDTELRWRAAWALARARDTVALPLLLELSQDTSAEVRSWAVRGLARQPGDTSASGFSPAQLSLLGALRDDDRRVRAEAVRALGTYADGTSLIQLVVLLQEDDPWTAVGAAEGIRSRGDKARAAIPELIKTTETGATPWLRGAALIALADVWLSASLAPATAMASDTSLTVRMAAANVLAKLKYGGRAGLEKLRNDPDRDLRAMVNSAWLLLADTTDDPAARRASRAAAFASRDVAMRAAAAMSIAAWADSTDIPTLLDAFAVALKDTSTRAQDAIIETLADIESRGGSAAAAFFARYRTAPSDVVYGMAGRAFGPKTLAAWGSGRPVRSTRTDADYRRITETLVVPAFNGAALPRLRWETTRGSVDTELHALDAPLATDYLLSLVARGAMQGIRFGRVIPNFVAQQNTVLAEGTLQRDETNRARLVRGNLSWGTNVGNARRFPGTRGPGASFDTGPAVYVFAHTPQPHNEGDFTSLGRIVAGMDVVDRMELGDYVKSVRVLKPGEK